MARFVFSAFADEAGTTIEEQIQALSENGIRYIEPRQINKKGILDLSDISDMTGWYFKFPILIKHITKNADSINPTNIFG